MSKILTVDLPGRAYDIEIERGLLDKVGERCKAVLPRAKALFVVTDSTVGPLYAQRVLDSLEKAGFTAVLHTVPAGEESKCVERLQELWEAMMAANKYHLDNLCACVDVNGLQIDGETKDVMPTEPLDKKFEAFGWHVIKCDGHDFNQIEAAYKEAEQTKGQPTMILAKTIKGKGVSFMENNAGWHGKAPNDEQWAQAKAELEAKIKELEG